MAHSIVIDGSMGRMAGYLIWVLSKSEKRASKFKKEAKEEEENKKEEKEKEKEKEKREKKNKKEEEKTDLPVVDDAGGGRKDLGFMGFMTLMEENPRILGRN
jgi:mannitol-specific phosphotransferase system IIBC component